MGVREAAGRSGAWLRGRAADAREAGVRPVAEKGRAWVGQRVRDVRARTQRAAEEEQGSAAS